MLITALLCATLIRSVKIACGFFCLGEINGTEPIVEKEEL